MANPLTDPQQGEPREIVAGDKTAWRRDDLAGDYASADGWTLAYVLVWTGGGTAPVAMTADAQGWKAIADAAAYDAGQVNWFLRANHATFGMTTVDRGMLNVLVDPASAGAGYDPRSHSRRVLDKIEAAIEGRASETDLEWTFQDGRSLKRMTHGELLTMRDAYAAKVKREERIASGRGPGRVLVSL